MQNDRQKKGYKTQVEILQKQINQIKNLLTDNPNFFNEDFIESKISSNSKSSAKNTIDDFDKLLPEKKRNFILQMLEDLGITTNGQSLLSERKKGALRGIVEASRESGLLPLLSIDHLCSLLAEKISMDLNSKLNFSNIRNEYHKKATHYIADNYKA